MKMYFNVLAIPAHKATYMLRAFCLYGFKVRTCFLAKPFLQLV